MRKIVTIVILVVVSFGLQAQRYKPSSILNYQKVDQKWLHFGFTLAVNTMDFAVYNSGEGLSRAEQVVFAPGFSVGIISDLRLNEDWNLRFLPGLVFGQRTIHFSQLSQEIVDVESVMVNLPLLLKYRAKRINNYRPYLISGVSYKFDVQSQKRLDPEDNMLIRLNSSDLYYELGVGIDFYLQYFKFSTELKFAIGLMDILNHEYDVENPGFEAYTDGIRKINSKIITLSFHFE